MNGDGINEYIIYSSHFDSVMMYCHNGKVYVHSFTFDEFNNLKKDGSFYWNDSDGRGAARLSFDGAKIKYNIIYATVYDENKNAGYYLNEKEVTYDAYTEFLKTQSNAFADSLPFDAPWYDAISEEEALQIASEYWNVKNGDVDKETGYRLALLRKASNSNNYCIALSCFVEETHYSTIETIEIDAFTGEISECDDVASHPSETEMAMEMYEAAIKGEICVFDERVGETSLRSLRFTSNGSRLEECKLLKKAIADIDGDGADEFIIQSPDNEYIILRYHNGKVYSYRLDIGDYYIFNTDGTFYRHDSFETNGFNCGLYKIVFDGETLNTKTICRRKYSKNSSEYEYFVEGETLTEYEYHTYRTDSICNERIKFSYFELACSYPITAERAWNLANAYWDNQDGKTDGAVGSVYTARVVLTDTPNSDAEYYRVAFQVERTLNDIGWHGALVPREIKLKEQILINAFTGEITTPES